MDDETARLLLELARARSLWEICNAACALLDNPVFITDTNHTVLAYTNSITIDDPMWQDGIVRGTLEGRTLKKSGEVRQNHKLSQDECRPILTPPSGPFKYSRIVHVILDHGVPSGVMVNSGTFRNCTEDDIPLMEIISAFARPLLLHKFRGHLKNSKSISNFLIGLLDGNVDSRMTLDKRMKNLRMTPLPWQYVLTFASGTVPEDEQPLIELVRDISFAAKNEAFVYENLIVCVMGSDSPLLDFDRHCPALHDLVSKKGLFVGVSRRFSSLLDVRAHYLEAVSALDIGMILGRHSPYKFFDDLAMYRLFKSAGDALSACCSQKIRDLDMYDKKHRTDLCMTLHVYLDSDRDLSRTAEILFVHKNTVRYRIEKCKKILFGSVDKEGDFFSIFLSLRILEYERKFLNR